MKKNTKCVACNNIFEEGEGIYIVKHDNGSITYLCEDCFKEKYENDAEFKAWWDNDTRSLSMDEDELNEEFGSGSLEELNESSYYTTFEEDEDETISIEKINLSEIFDLNANDFCELRDLNDTAVMSKEVFIETVKSICKQVLDLASENAKMNIYKENMNKAFDNELTTEDEHSYGEYNPNGADYHVNVCINEQSILDTMKQIE